jgi:hypothetical protein
MSKDMMGDERLKKDSGLAQRGGRDNADVSRVTEDGMALSAAERKRMLRQEWVQEVLPTPPGIPGFHLCWVSTTNSTDPIHKRMQLGYQPVRITEVPGFDQYKVADGGQFDGCIACNEMLLFKIPQERYQDIMTIYHHDIPLEQERSIFEKVSASNEVDSNGRPLGMVEGDFNQLGRSPTRTPQFA